MALLSATPGFQSREGSQPENIPPWRNPSVACHVSYTGRDLDFVILLVRIHVATQQPVTTQADMNWDNTRETKLSRIILCVVDKYRTGFTECGNAGLLRS